ncbi:MAG TPA: SAM-dependent chlorinase/fluorinase [Acidimicrobiales bacterium]|nr:SAM-dependent chlorinase/fluorinase [Acidimicrobiales bacterium]
MKSPERGSVFFLTDYGGADEFAGVVRAVVARHAPGAPLVDLTHAVPPFDVRAGALALERAAPYLGPGVVLAVVDPGVGSQRRAVAVERAAPSGPRHFVGPDNGLLPWALDVLGGTISVVALARAPGAEPAEQVATASTEPSSSSRTFDGRDLFAPVVAGLWSGVPLRDIGSPVDVDSLVRLARPRLVVGAQGVEAEVQWVDGFGNAQLAARPDDVGDAAAFLVVTRSTTCRAARVGTFAELVEGELGVVEDANGHLALTCNRQAAATVLGVREGDVVTLKPVAGP